MKTFLSMIITLFIGNSAFGAAQLVDLYNCTGHEVNVSIKIYAAGEPGAYYSITTSDLDDVQKEYRMLKSEHDRLVSAGTFIGLDKKVNTQGVLGTGIIVSINGASSTLVDHGVIRIMNCKEVVD